MDNIKNDSYYLKRIIQDVDFIINHTDKLTLEEFQSDINPTAIVPRGPLWTI